MRCILIYIFFCRHVLLVMFITFLWIAWIQLACASQLGTTFARFELTGLASNQVECCSFILILIFVLFFLPLCLFVCLFGHIRLVPQDTCGTREILKDENPSEHATRHETISPNFTNTRRVEQVSVSKLCISTIDTLLIIFTRFVLFNHSDYLRFFKASWP